MAVKPASQSTSQDHLPADWRLVKVSSIATVGRGRVISHREIARALTPTYPVYSSQTSSNGVMGYLDSYDFEGEYVTWTTDGANAGTVFHRNGRFNCTNVCGTIKVDRNDARFVSLILSRIAPRYVSRQLGNPKLMNDVMKQVEIPLPHSIAEQRAIAAALTDVDRLVDGLDSLIAKKRGLKQAAMLQLLTGQVRLPGFNGEWQVRQLAEVVVIRKGQLITRATLVPGNIPVIAGGKQPAYFHSTPNRVGRTITISASGASAGYVALHHRPIFASDCSTISESAGYCLDFIFYSLLSKQQAIYSAQTGGAQPHIHAKDLNPMPLSWPSKSEQAAIAAALSDMDAELIALELQREKICDIKKAMMQELLTGRTRLPLDEASA
jgi:restriction endonuclease S subunit